MYDIIIIGAGVSGCAAARELSRYQAKIAVVEKDEDVCCGTSKANSAIVHAGFDAEPGSKMAEMNIKGSQMMEQLAKDLDFPFRRNGSLVLCLREEERENLQSLYEKGIKNGVTGLQILSGEEAKALEPNITDDVVAALYAPTGGIVCPFGLTIALAESSAANGVNFYFNTEVRQIQKSENGFCLLTSQGELHTRYIVNAAGVYADKLHNMVSETKIHITPRKGEYCLLDKAAGNLIDKTIFTLPGKYGKGVLVTPTVHGNLLLGPTASDIQDKEGTNTTGAGLQEVLSKAQQSVKNIPVRQVITSFAGLRAHEDDHDFIIKELEDSPGFIDCAGIESPGLSSAPAIGVEIANIIKKAACLREKADFKATRKGILKPENLSSKEYETLVKENPAYGNIICRCEMISEGEILDAIHRTPGAKSLDGIKRRTRAGMGRCQSGFCLPRTMEILSRELGMPMTEITKSGPGSSIIEGIDMDEFKEQDA